MKLIWLFPFAMGRLVIAPVEAGEPAAAELSGVVRHTLFNPTPRDAWRELAPDRPDTTESPITVDAGVWVVEASYFDWRRDGGDDTFTVMATNVKVGLTERIDFQTVFDAYTWEDLASGVGAEGFSDVTLRLKYNVWGNDGGRTSLALFPFIKIPTDTALSNGQVEGGLILPFSVDLANGIGLGLMAEFDVVHDGIGDYDLEFVHSAVLGFDVTERTGVFAEYVGVAGPGDYQASIATGATLTVTDDLIFDAGVKVGLTGAAEDVGVFGGITKRF